MLKMYNSFWFILDFSQHVNALSQSSNFSHCQQKASAIFEDLTEKVKRLQKCFNLMQIMIGSVDLRIAKLSTVQEAASADEETEKIFHAVLNQQTNTNGCTPDGFLIGDEKCSLSKASVLRPKLKARKDCFTLMTGRNFPRHLTVLVFLL